MFSHTLGRPEHRTFKEIETKVGHVPIVDELEPGLKLEYRLV